MLGNDVTDLVPEHAGELRLVLKPIPPPWRDGDLPSRQSERVDRVGVIDEVEVEVAGEVGLGRARVADEALANFVDQSGIRVARRRNLAAHLRDHLLRRLEPQRLLLVDVHRPAVALARLGVEDLFLREVPDDADERDDDGDDPPPPAAAATLTVVSEDGHARVLARIEASGSAGSLAPSPCTRQHFAPRRLSARARSSSPPY